MPTLLPYHFEIIAKLAARRSRRMRRADLADELEIADRTLERSVKRYERFLDTLPAGLPFRLPRIRAVQGDDRRAHLELEHVDPTRLDVWRYAALRLAVRHLEVIDRDGAVGGAAEAALATLPNAPSNETLDRIERGFYYRALGPKRYDGALADVLDEVCTAIVDGRPMAITYRASGRNEASHYRFAPWTLAAYRDGFYVVGCIGDADTPSLLAVDRIESAERDRAGTVEIPDDYDPDTWFAGHFGVYRSGEPVTIRLAFEPAAARGAAERVWPGATGWSTLADGREVLELSLPVTPDFVAWILSWGAAVEVIAPKSLRGRIVDELEAMGSRYQ